MDSVTAANLAMAQERRAAAVKVRPCSKGCGWMITMVQSKKTGKWYPANVLINGGGSYRVMPVYAANGAHVHKCDQPDTHGVRRTS